MLEKIEIYDAITSLLHGTVFIIVSFVLFPQLMNVISPLEVSQIVTSIGFISIAFFVGQIIISVSSLMQPFLFWTWGGMPSKQAFDGKLSDKYLPSDMIQLARAALQKLSQTKLSDTALFCKAMSIARKAEGSLSECHNQMYAYNRAAFCNLILISGLFAMSCLYGICKSFGSGRIISIATGFFLLLLLHWYRAKQRAFYYVREVLVVAERELSGDK